MRSGLSRRTALGVAAGIGLAAAGAALLGTAFSKPLALPQAPLAITVKARPIATFKPGDETDRFGALTFLGGLVLTSDFAGFGGISGFSLGKSGRFLAVTDAGVFISGHLDTDGDRPTGLSDVKAAALFDGEHRTQATRGRGDAEALTVGPDGIYVAMEDVNEIWRYPSDPMGKAGAIVPAPAIRNLRNNLGLESLAFIPSGPLQGALVGVGEAGTDAKADLPGFIIGGRHPGTFTVAKSAAFSATDLALGPAGEMYLLERHYSPATGVRMQIRRFSLADVKAGARLEGEVLGSFDMGYEIDNMEGLAVTTNTAGETILTLVSDDNFNPLQRTILLRFAVAVD
ncbi:esterase-like activity of phytase family protein [Xanthobacter dioxanivorans]|uniref:Esterase-like activity of phytase family protein n=1 Tax=Xanthobacter dioxanivorans TaxID=2528964 RepID=A0A974SL66_9HYPH|nr:esterase-like activity of phytase family protein [Xanthobacter dioxanivorans]QRG08228.1 esterase-like activity of phytase family protein [Xanthobacter dioxanivorans]